MRAELNGRVTGAVTHVDSQPKLHVVDIGDAYSCLLWERQNTNILHQLE